MMTLQQFIATYTGKPIDVDHVYGPQCVDLANAYARDVLGAPLFAGNAVDIFSMFPTTAYTRAVNTPSNFPAPGDIIIWGGPNATVGTTEYGHIAVCITSTIAAFTSFDQNWPEGSVCHAQPHTYDAVL